MAQLVTVQSLVDDSARAAGLEYSAPSHVTAAEHLDLVRRAYDLFRNRLIDARGAEYYSVAIGFVTTPGQHLYSLATIITANDLFELLGAPILVDGSTARQMTQWEVGELADLWQRELTGSTTSAEIRYRLVGDTLELRPKPLGAYSIGFRYIPRAPVLVTGAPGAGEASSIDGYSGFHQWIIYTVAIALRRKRSLDTQELERERALVTESIDALRSKRDAASPPRIISRGNPWSLGTPTDLDYEAP